MVSLYTADTDRCFIKPTVLYIKKNHDKEDLLYLFKHNVYSVQNYKNNYRNV